MEQSEVRCHEFCEARCKEEPMSEQSMQASILQVLENDSAHIQKLLSSEGSRAKGPGSASTMDNCQLMETVHENHAEHLMPQVARIVADFKQLYQQCLDDKVALPTELGGLVENVALI